MKTGVKIKLQNECLSGIKSKGASISACCLFKFLDQPFRGCTGENKEWSGYSDRFLLVRCKQATEVVLTHFLDAWSLEESTDLHSLSFFDTTIILSSVFWLCIVFISGRLQSSLQNVCCFDMNYCKQFLNNIFIHNSLQ